MSELQSRSELSARLWRENPVLVHLFGLSPLLAVTTSAATALGLAVISILVFLCTALTLALLKIPGKDTWRFFFYLFVLALFTTVAERLVYLWLPSMHSAIGLYLPLIACNFAMLVQLDNCRGATAARSLAGVARTGLGWLLVMVLMGGLREVLLTGTLFQNLALLLPAGQGAGTESLPVSGGEFIASPAFALLLLGLLAALYRSLPISSTKAPSPEEIEPAPRARVTGKLRGQHEQG